jgi:protein ImuB
MYWLALYFPALPLEIHSRALPDAGPLAVVVRERGRRILLCDEAAAAQGVAPGQGVATALALAADLRLLPHRLSSVKAALERLALWGSRFSSYVSLVPPAGLLMEAGGSLTLFGGAEGLVQQVRHGLKGLGYRSHWCLAATPESAMVLARLGADRILADPGVARAALGRVPLAALALEPRVRETLEAMGVATLGALMRLPRAGLARRFGPGLTLYLARLVGELPDPRPAHVPLPCFRGRLELPAEVDQAPALLFAARRLVEELCGFLQGRGLGVQRLDWTLVHARRQFSHVALGLARPSRGAEHLIDLLRERLEPLELPAPVREIRLQARNPEPFHPPSRRLFPGLGRPSLEVGTQLLERLRARLGPTAVQGLDLVADHRPERAWCYREPGGQTEGQGQADRPLWLLLEPRLLEHREGWPWLEGQRLQLGVERERVESGWWDGSEVARDYFTARTPQGARLWVFRELKGARRWFLHGWFL